MGVRSDAGRHLLAAAAGLESEGNTGRSQIDIELIASRVGNFYGVQTIETNLRISKCKCTS
jgi:hypothetical protein